MKVNLRSEINDFILSLVKKYNDISEIWLIGSRANHAHVRPDSDWDFVIFAKPSLYQTLKQDNVYKEMAESLYIDLLVENRKNIFESPWYQKRITIKDMKWQKISDNTVRYWAAKLKEFDPSERPYLSEWEEYALKRGADLSDDISSWKNGIRIWPIKWRK